MRIAAISDIHGNLAALQAVLDDIERRAVDQVVNLGDILSGPLQPAETADLLMQRGFVTIAGNHERQLLALRDGRTSWNLASSDGFAAAAIDGGQEAWLRSLPATHRLTADVLLVHGTPGSDLVYWMDTVDAGRLRAATEEEAAERVGDGIAPGTLVLCGHTHVPRAMRVRGCLVVNPGSVGLQAYESDHPAPHRMEIGSPEARYAIVEKGARGWRVEHHAVPYDWSPQAALAAERGRADWAQALATGRVTPPAGAPA